MTIRANLAKLCDQVTASRDIVWISRRQGANVALIAAEELESLLATAYLLRSPSYKRLTWQDLRAIAKALEQTPTS